jgi:adenylate cyclase class 2
MSKSKDQELEVKYLVLDLNRIHRKLVELKAEEFQPRLHELNLRFDTSQRHLSKALQVLRLRQDSSARLTFKGPLSDSGGVRVRQEIEFTVGDFASAQAFLTALGYHVLMIYEKFRTVYHLGGIEVCLDELPYGKFVEIEGKKPKDIIRTSESLGLKWEARIDESYTDLFGIVCRELQLNFRDLIFENFDNLYIKPSHLGVIPADVKT